MRITTIQAKLAWEDKSKNLGHFDQLLKPLKGKTDLIILPEMFTTGFTMNPQPIAERMNGPSIQWIQKQAKELNAAICGSLVISEGNNYYNRLIWAQPDGVLLRYDKRHLFTLAGEDAVYTSGNTKLTLDYKGWKICPQICYDLRFPVWSRNCENYNLLIYVANWPKSRSEHWKALLRARAIENQCYLAGVNRVGIDKNGLVYQGDTMIIDYSGVVLSHEVNREAISTIDLNKENLDQFRKKYNFLADRDHFSLK